MLIEIFDVDHGFCALVTGDDGQHVLLDCGHNGLTGLRPSTILSARGIRWLDALIISHGDEDHVSDLPAMLRSVSVRSIISNDSVTHDTLLRVAEGIGAGRQAFIYCKNPLRVKLRGDDPHPMLPQVELIFYRNRYPYFSDANNLSLVTFLHYGDIHAVFPGDLEAAGWRALLQHPGFCRQLARVNVFVASHHGRENGFYGGVFGACVPELVIVSDGPIQCASQEMTDRYARRALGVYFGSERRRVLTTRCDGTIRLFQSLNDRTRAWVTLHPSHRLSLPRAEARGT
jgi:beta-lactamase superfamily II metal-dependent hydrolase